MGFDRAQIHHRVTQCLLVLSCLGLGGGATIILIHDLEEMAGVRSARRMGEVVGRLGVARQRTPQSLLWRVLGLNQALYLRDSILVGPESFVTVKLDNGNSLEIGENSLVVLEETAGLDVRVLRGALVLKSADGEKSVEASGKDAPRVQKFPFQLLEPQPYAKFFVGTSVQRPTIDFRWRGIGANETVVEISRSRKFLEIVDSVPVTSRGTVEMKFPSASGIYYWRLASEGVAFSSVRSFEVAHVSPLDAHSPAAGQKIARDEKGVRFTWTAPTRLHGFVEKARHVIEVSAQKDFSSLGIRKSIAWDASEIYLSEVPVGKFFWRIVSTYGDVRETSAEHAFETFAWVKKESPVPIKILRGPSDHIMAYDAPQRIPFEWQQIESGGDYQFVLAGDSDFRSIISTEKISASRLEIKDSLLNPGNYFWRVSHVNAQGNVTVSSETQKFNVNLPRIQAAARPLSPKPNEMVVGIKAKAISLDWEKIPGAVAYSVVVKKGDAVVAQSSGTQNRWTLSNLKVGDYEWEITYQDRFGRKVTTPPQRFIVQYGPILRAPAFDVRKGKR